MFSLGKNSHLGAYCYVNVCFGSVQIGDHVAVGPGTKIISYSNHYALGEKVTEKTITADIVIGNNVLIGANCTLLPGSRIHDNVVIGAGAVVKGELAANAIYGGIPCSRIKFLGHD
jgi:acetyltransferase-like isoleucine patch superfamily enzyme